MTLTISLPPSAETELQQRANAAGQKLEQFVEQLIIREVTASPSNPHDAEAALDAQYERGYIAIPEDAAEVIALMPHLAVDQEGWE